MKSNLHWIALHIETTSALLAIVELYGAGIQGLALRGPDLVGDTSLFQCIS